MTSSIQNVSTSTAKVYGKIVTDDSTNTAWSCPDIGMVRKNDSRVSVNGKLAKGDKEDYYKIGIQSAGKFQLYTTADGPFRIQVLNVNGRVVADSLNGRGAATDNYKAMLRGTYEASASPLTVRVMRDPTSGTITEPVNYTVKANMGTNTTDWVSTENNPASSTTAPVAYNPVVNLFSSYFSNAPSIFSFFR